MPRGTEPEGHRQEPTEAQAYLHERTEATETSGYLYERMKGARYAGSQKSPHRMGSLVWAAEVGLLAPIRSR